MLKLCDDCKFSIMRMSTGEQTSRVEGLDGPEKMLGRQILDFELSAVLGSGGMSVVYHGRHRLTHQEVAIKILPPELAAHSELKARFVEEARVLARLEHPNIVTLNNFVESGGRLCLIMQFCEGETFEKQIARQKQMPPEDAVRVGIEVLRALEYAHKQSVIHRDIKPSNIIVRPDGTIKVTDFGIAKILGQSRLTSTGQTMGTVRYMSPEQVRGRRVDARSDLYSLAVTLFEALSGRTPFEGENQFAIMEQHLNKRPPSLASFGAEVPASIERALLVALSKSADDRYPDAPAFREALERAVEQSAAGTPAHRVKRLSLANGGRALALGLGGVVLLGSGVAAFVVGRRPPTNPPVIASATSAATPAHFPVPHQVAGVTVQVDRSFPADGLRIQSVLPRDTARLAAKVREISTALRLFLGRATQAAARGAAGASIRPLNLVVVPESVLNKPELWPGYRLDAESTYPSRYVEAKSTLFVADTVGFERRELPYGVALHVLAPLRDLSNEECLALAEKFQAEFLAKSAQ
jgi:hypothetical protein